MDDEPNNRDEPPGSLEGSAMQEQLGVRRRRSAYRGRKSFQSSSTLGAYLFALRNRTSLLRHPVVSKART